MVTPPKITFIVVSTIALLSAVYIGTLAYLTVMGINPGDVLKDFTNAGNVIVGALIGLLINTRSQPSEPTPTTIVNDSSKPVPVREE